MEDLLEGKNTSGYTPDDVWTHKPSNQKASIAGAAAAAAGAGASASEASAGAAAALGNACPDNTIHARKTRANTDSIIVH
jgi:hypothetical protein